MRFHLGVASKVRRMFITKEQTLNGANPDDGLDLKSNPVDFVFVCKSPDSGSKEETFFDSRPWIDSDCEDDFYSVNGEFTPSRGSTPNYQTGTPRLKPLFVDKFPDSKSEISPTGRKKLADLLRETMQGEKVHSEQDTVDVKEAQGKQDIDNIKADGSLKSLNGTPHSPGSYSVRSSEVTPTGDAKKRKVKILKMDCCLPSLVYNISFNDRRAKMSPVCASSY